MWMLNAGSGSYTGARAERGETTGEGEQGDAQAGECGRWTKLSSSVAVGAGVEGTMSRVTQRAKSAEAVKGREIYGYMYEYAFHRQDVIGGD